VTSAPAGGSRMADAHADLDGGMDVALGGSRKLVVAVAPGVLAPVAGVVRRLWVRPAASAVAVPQALAR
jgi:hypothetical protein